MPPRRFMRFLREHEVPPRRYAWTGSNLKVKVAVGGDHPAHRDKGATIFHVEKEMLVFYSTFCEKVLADGQWKYATEQQINLPNSDPRCFGIILHWMLRDEIDCGENRGRFRLLFEVWVLADYLGMLECKNAIIDELAAVFQTGKLIDSDALKYLYANTTNQHRIRLFVVHASCLTGLFHPEIVPTWPRQFLVDCLCCNSSISHLGTVVQEPEFYQAFIGTRDLNAHEYHDRHGSVNSVNGYRTPSEHEETENEGDDEEMDDVAVDGGAHGSGDEHEESDDEMDEDGEDDGADESDGGESDNLVE